ncbi:MAG: glycosyltransferase [Candidatus Zixiibacteriota bacterium]
MNGAATKDSEKIPIVYVIDNFYRGGGTENQLAILIDHLDRSRFTPYVFNLRPKWPDKDIEIDCGITYLNVSRFLSFNSVKAVLRIARFLRKRKAKILQVYFFDSRIIGTIAGRLARMKKIIFCRREMGWWATPGKLKIMQRLAKASHYCLVNAHAIRRLVVETENFPEDKIEVIHNGIELKRRAEGKPKTKTDFGIPENAPVVVMVANLRPVKRIDRLINCMAGLENKSVHLLVVGEGPLLDDLKSRAEQLGIGERVHFYYAGEGVYDILQMSDIGVLTSESEGLSNALIEYLFAGLPAIAFDTGGNDEIIDNGRTGFIIPKWDEKLMTEKIDWLLKNPDESKKMGETARQYAQSKFSVPARVKKTEDFYKKILE